MPDTAHGHAGGGGASLHAQLDVNPFQMFFHGHRAGAQNFAYVSVGLAFNLKFLPPKAEFLLSNSRKRGSAFCLRFDLINQFDGAFLPYC